MDWKKLIYRTDLTEVELKQIPSRCAINNKTSLDFFVKENKDVSLLTKNTGMTADELVDSDCWLNPIQAFNYDCNYFRYIDNFPVHTEYDKGGFDFINHESSAIKLLMRLTPLNILLKQVQIENSKFNNEVYIEFYKKARKHYEILLKPYPYFQKMGVGHECHYVRGVLKAVALMKGFVNVNFVEQFCSKVLKNIVNYYYSRYGFKYIDKRKEIYVNDQKIAEKTGGCHPK